MDRKTQKLQAQAESIEEENEKLLDGLLKKRAAGTITKEEELALEELSLMNQQTLAELNGEKKAHAENKETQ